MAIVMVVAAALAAPLAVQAQTTGYGGFSPEDHNRGSAALNYCSALSELYVRYVGRSETGPRSNRWPDVEGGVAVAKCNEGDAAVAIPVLERKLTDARITLPARP